MDLDQLAARHSAAIRHHWRNLADNDGQATEALLAELAGIAYDHRGGGSEQELRDSLDDLSHRHDRLLKAYRALTEEVIAGLAAAGHEKTEEAGLPFCRCGVSLAGGDASGAFITHALAVLGAERAARATGKAGGGGEFAPEPSIAVSPGEPERRSIPAGTTQARTRTRSRGAAK